MTLQNILENAKIEVREMPELALEQISAVYVGKPDTCTCGCAGEYIYPKVSQEYASENRGYAVTGDEVNDERVMRVIKRMAKHASEGVEVYIQSIGKNAGCYILSMQIGKTMYTVYTR